MQTEQQSTICTNFFSATKAFLPILCYDQLDAYGDEIEPLLSLGLDRKKLYIEVLL